MGIMGGYARVGLDGHRYYIGVLSTDEFRVERIEEPSRAEEVAGIREDLPLSGENVVYIRPGKNLTNGAVITSLHVSYRAGAQLSAVAVVALPDGTELPVEPHFLFNLIGPAAGVEAA